MAFRTILIAAALVSLGFCRQLSADETVSWSGHPIMGRGEYSPEGNAVFTVNEDTLTLRLTYTGGNLRLNRLGQTMTGVTFDLEGFNGSLTATSAMIADGSRLVGAGSGDYDTRNLSGHWAFKDDIHSELLGQYGVGSMGDINFGEDSFGRWDVIDSSYSMSRPALGGVDYSIVGPHAYMRSGGFRNQSPFVQNSMVFTFNYEGDLSEDMIRHVLPLFGSVGATTTGATTLVTPEPASLLVFGASLLGIALLASRRRRASR